MNNLLSHEFSISPILCDLSPFLLGMALGHRGLPGPHAARPVGLVSRSGSDPAAIPLHATGAGSALDRAGRKGEAMVCSVLGLQCWQWWLGRQIEVVGLNAQSRSSPRAWEGCGCWCAWTLLPWACEHQTLQSCPHSSAGLSRPPQVFLSHTEGWPPPQREKLCLLLAP